MFTRDVRLTSLNWLHLQAEAFYFVYVEYIRLRWKIIKHSEKYS